MKIQAEFLFPEELKEEAIICNLCKQFDIVLKIVEASFSTETGWAILRIEAEPAELRRTLDYLKERHIEIKKIEEIE
jgi:ABC-type methionine transport system ATPase subunit